MPRRPHIIPRLLCLIALTALTASAVMPSAVAKPPAQAGEVRHYEGPPWLGFVADRKSEDVLRVGGVLRKSPASRAGLKTGDVVLEVDDTEVKGVRDLKIVLRAHVVGDTLDLKVLRAGKTFDAELTLASTPTQKELARDQLMGEVAPDFTVPAVTLDEKKASSHTLADLKGKITVIEFWATWCKPCEPFKSELAALHARHGDAIHILAISNEEAQTLRTHLSMERLPYAIGSDTSEAVHDAYFVRALPLVLVLDAEHKVRKVITGDDGPALITKSIQSLMKSESK